MTLNLELNQAHIAHQIPIKLIINQMLKSFKKYVLLLQDLLITIKALKLYPRIAFKSFQVLVYLLKLNLIKALRFNMKLL